MCTIGFMNKPPLRRADEVLCENSFSFTPEGRGIRPTEIKSNDFYIYRSGCEPNLIFIS